MTQECPHTPKCASHCAKCGAPLPDFPDKEAGKNRYVVTFENGAVHFGIPGDTEEDAMEYAIVSVCRLSGLCRDHVVRVKNVIKETPWNPNQKTL